LWDELTHPEITALAKIEKQKLSDAVVGELGRLINNGRLRAGDKLPCQSALAARLGVSRNTLREAMHSLTLAGVLDQRQGSGTFVRCNYPGSLMGYLKPPSVNGLNKAVELMEARTLIEVANARMACKNAPAEVLAELSRLCACMSAALDLHEHEIFFKHDAEFHHTLAKGAGNPFMEHLFLIIRGLIEPLIQERIPVCSASLESFQIDHQRICNAVASRNLSSAAAEMVRHMANVREAIAVIAEADNSKKRSLRRFSRSEIQTWPSDITTEIAAEADR
jgi:GntR family transcriptional regulator, transcriptional repressor for pyruvate dehydrogenase complex